MNGTDWFVIAGGVGAALWVNWYFFLARREIVSAIGSKDFYVVQAGVIMLALIFAGLNLLIDLAYVWIDPRIRFGPQ